ncbi:MAG: 16S rRNA (guanine(966)-N(2))-methyltransferase RsmD [Elusimicrobia bacterium]|nr:MAG: 16S rRNA (guanine(966)-N(2))-methyltransferase RsmD [Elusimicrobiota bacterium]
MAMRIIAGTARGRQIISVSTKIMVKPISGRMRQSLFDILRPKVTGSHFLDLFAGTGAVGLEALSRGAGRVVFCEKDTRCMKTIEKNLVKFNWQDRGKPFRADVTEPLSWVPFRSGIEEFDLVFMGPPYRTQDNTPLALTNPVLQRIAQAKFLADGAWVIAQHHNKEKPGDVPGLEQFRQEKYGDTLISFYKQA